MRSQTAENDRRAQRSGTMSKKATLLTAATANNASLDSPGVMTPMSPFGGSDSGFQTPNRTESSDISPPDSPHYTMQVQRGGSPPPYAIDHLKRGQQNSDDAAAADAADANLKDSDSFQLPWPKAADSQQKNVAQRLDDALKVATDLQHLGDQTQSAADKEPQPKAKKNGRVIGVDFDDVCAQFVPVIQREHNARFGTDLTEDDMQTYAFFQCKGWGTPADAARKMRQFDALLPKTAPVVGFVEGLRALHAMGHPVHIVTARSKDSEPEILAWLAELGITVGVGEDDVIAAIWFTDAYGASRPPIPEKGETPSAIEREDKLNEELRQVWRETIGSGKGGKTKLKVLRAINAALFVDDHHGNLEPIIHADPPVPCLLFGKYAWNRSRSGVSSPVELMSYDERMQAGLALQLETITECEKLARAETWDDVVQWVKKWDEAEDTAA